MAALVCDICGGKLVGKPGGLFECEYCGMEYNTDWAKAKIQEIKGTVQVEGTVQVAGTVKVEGSVNLESLLNRGRLALEDEEWKRAEEFFDEALNINSKCSDVYLGKLMALVKVGNPAKLVELDNSIEEYPDFQKAMRFGNDEQKRTLSEYAEQIQNKITLHRMALMKRRKQIAPVANLIFCAERDTTIGIKPDGTILAVGPSRTYQEFSEWRNIISVCAGRDHFVGLKSDGTVVAVGDKCDGKCNVSAWTNIVAICAGLYITVGLKSNGTVVVSSENDPGGRLLHGWNDIVAIAAGDTHIVGLRSDGSVIAKAGNFIRECEENDWCDIVAISASEDRTIGLKADGTVVAVGNNRRYPKGYGPCGVEGWRDIVAINAGVCYTAGLKADGTVVATDTFSTQMHKWSDIVAISTGTVHTAGLKSDGTLVISCLNGASGVCDSWFDVKGWRLFKNINNLEQERKTAKAALQIRDEKARIARIKKEEEERIAREKWEEEKRIAREKKAEEERIARERRNAGLCQHCGGVLKGFFSKKCVSCGKPKDY